LQTVLQLQSLQKRVQISIETQQTFNRLQHFLKDVVNLAERKQKRESEGAMEPEMEETGFVLEPTRIELGSGYTISVSYDENEKPIVSVMTYGEVDMAKLQKEIGRIFPNAQIRQLNQTRSVTIVKKRKRKPNIKKK
jgi:hypothetical protein